MAQPYLGRSSLDSPGIHSDRYIFVAIALMNESHRQEISKMIAKNFANDKFDAVAGYDVGGVLLGYETGKQMGIPTVFGCEILEGVVRFENAYKIRNGGSVLLVDDVLFYEKPIMSAMDALTSAGGKVNGIGLVLNCMKDEPNFGVKTFVGLNMPINMYETEEATAETIGSRHLVNPTRRLGESNEGTAESEQPIFSPSISLQPQPDSSKCPMCHELEPTKDVTRARFNKEVASSLYHDRHNKSIIEDGFKMYERLLDAARQEARTAGKPHHL
jgi:orotate phosphoribosyltransferase